MTRFQPCLRSQLWKELHHWVAVLVCSGNVGFCKLYIWILHHLDHLVVCAARSRLWLDCVIVIFLARLFLDKFKVCWTDERSGNVFASRLSCPPGAWWRSSRGLWNVTGKGNASWGGWLNDTVDLVEMLSCDGWNQFRTLASGSWPACRRGLRRNFRHCNF